ncbi:prolyl 4-hydroxylase subunit alpha-2 isoform X2 [Drosophila montana]|uniref:prolyl 4-hydroxylase subunit alpha-2 isoform X2 n=1 Tax=Drosophila montana TaxID=40370 RepID=UPI00313E2E33
MMVGILCLLLLLIASAQSENISVGELKSVVKLERELLHNLRIYAQELETRLRLINGLSSLDCYHMGRELYEQQKYHEAVDWLAAAAAKYSPTSPHDELLGVSLGRIYEMQLKVFKKLNMRVEALVVLSRALELQPENKLLRSQQHQLEQQEPVHPSPASAEPPSKLQKQCRGNYKQNTYLVCELNDMLTPFLQLAPLRLEEAWDEPYVIIYKDGIYEREIGHIKHAFEHCPSSARLWTIAGVKGCTISDRFSVITTLLTDRIVDMTGLDLHKNQMFLFEYGPRDPFQLQDLYQSIDVNVEAIESTAILFLNDMALGGAITISSQQMAVFPRRGDALIVQNEEDIEYTVCPNVVGNRLVLIKFLTANE